MAVEVVFPGVFVEELPGGPRPIEGVSTSTTAFIGAAERGPTEPYLVRSWIEFEREFGGHSQTSTLSFAVRQFFENGGTRAVIVRAAGDGSAATQAGLRALDRTEFSLLCIPPYALSLDVDIAAWEAAANCCRERRAFLIVDAPAAWSLKDAAGHASSFRLSARENAAIYFPRLRVADPLDGSRLVSCAPCGCVAGIISRTDQTRGVWKAPAGIEAVVKGAAGLSAVPDENANEQLAAAGVNCLRNFPATAIVVWGARTLAGTEQDSSEWRYVPVRRLALYMQESLVRGTHWAVFEPNSEPTWKQLRSQVADFMTGLWRQGALQGARPNDAFYVRCDAGTTTQDDLDNGRVNIEIGFAPLRPAEFVIFRIQRSCGRRSSCQHPIHLRHRQEQVIQHARGRDRRDRRAVARELIVPVGAVGAHEVTARSARDAR